MPGMLAPASPGFAARRCEATALRGIEVLRYGTSAANQDLLPTADRACFFARRAPRPAHRGYTGDVDPAALQQLREQSGLRLDKEGRFWHRGELVEHARTAAVLHQGIHRAPDGRWATRIGTEWGYLDVEDAALWIRRLEPQGNRLRAQLASGEWVDLDPATLAAGADDALYARVRGERARLTRAAQLSLSDSLRQDATGFLLQLANESFRIGHDPGPEPVR